MPVTGCFSENIRLLYGTGFTKKEAAAKEKYQGSNPANKQNGNNRYFNYKMPETPILANQDKLLTKAFDFSEGKKTKLKLGGNQLKFDKLAQKYKTETLIILV